MKYYRRMKLIKFLLANDNLIYRAAIKGINTDIEKAFSDDYISEAFLAEAIIQNLISGM